MNKNVYFRPFTRTLGKQTAETTNPDENYTNDDLVIIGEFHNLINQIPSQTIKDRLSHIKNLFQANTVNKQQDLNNLKQENEKLIPQVESTKTELSSTKQKLMHLELEKRKIMEESDEQISTLSEENKNLKITIDSLQQQNKYQKLLIEEREETLKKQHQETIGHTFLIEELKNTIQNLSQKNYPMNYYQTTRYNSSFDVSSILGNEYSSSELNLCNKNENNDVNNLADLYHLQSEMESSNDKHLSNKSNQNQIDITSDKTTTSTEEQIDNEDSTKTFTAIKNKSSVNNSSYIENNIPYYITPNIIITNNKFLQNELESEGIINKKAKQDTMNIKEKELVEEKNIDPSNHESSQVTSFYKNKSMN